MRGNSHVTDSIPVHSTKPGPCDQCMFIVSSQIRLMLDEEEYSILQSSFSPSKCLLCSHASTCKFLQLFLNIQAEICIQLRVHFLLLLVSPLELKSSWRDQKRLLQERQRCYQWQIMSLHVTFSTLQEIYKEDKYKSDSSCHHSLNPVYIQTVFWAEIRAQRQKLYL